VRLDIGASVATVSLNVQVVVFPLLAPLFTWVRPPGRRVPDARHRGVYTRSSALP
jgi:hypothetical protein